MVKITKEFIPKSQKKQRPGYTMIPKYITVHNTANTSKGANAEMHSRYLLNGASGRSVGWHYTVDDQGIYQHLPTNENGWHAGDGSNGKGNRQSIGIEICENKDGYFEKAIKNAQALIKQLMQEHNIPLSNVVTHKHWSGKNCPRLLLHRWNDFIIGIGSTKTFTPPKKQTASKTVNKPKANLKVDGKLGKLTISALQRYFGTIVDGVISKPSLVIKALQRWLGVKVDGYLGPITISALQRRLGTPIDGIISEPVSLVIKELQRRLNRGRL
ncbi:peptidoglycan recognition protein family protein [Virgibacillus sp. W0430]|uniref:peptidoglycan recognition protein family protein n=1 Tax=Virgibacillus sp. W0430 TaxID=3391580 RepID=UPI003F47D719